MGRAKTTRTTKVLDPNEDQDTCRYANKKCYNKRGLKRNGGLHHLCHYHRDKANECQRRLAQKRKLLASMEQQQLSPSASLARHSTVSPRAKSPRRCSKYKKSLPKHDVMALDKELMEYPELMQLEPLTEPTSLREDDILALGEIFCGWNTQSSGDGVNGSSSESSGSGATASNCHAFVCAI